MSNLWTTLKRIPVLVIIVFSLFIVATIAVMIESSPSYDIQNFDYNKLVSIDIYDRGLLGSNKVELMNNDSLKLLSQHIKVSLKADYSKLNMKDNQGLCEMYLHFQENKERSITLTKLTSGDGIVTSGQFYYKNKELLNLLIEILRHSNRN